MPPVRGADGRSNEKSDFCCDDKSFGSLLSAGSDCIGGMAFSTAGSLGTGCSAVFCCEAVERACSGSDRSLLVVLERATLAESFVPVDVEHVWKWTEEARRIV